MGINNFLSLKIYLLRTQLILLIKIPCFVFSSLSIVNVTTAMPSRDRTEAAGSHWVTLSAQPWLLTALARTPDWLTVNLTCCNGLAQHPLQQVHAVDQVRCSSGGHPSPVHWLLWGRRRRSLWPVAPPTYVRDIPIQSWTWCYNTVILTYFTGAYQN